MGVILNSQELKTISVQQFNGFSKSAFGIKHKEVIEEASKLKPQATKIWLDQLSKINQKDIQAVFDRLPSDRITPEASLFAQELIQFNQDELLTLTRDIQPKIEQEESVSNYQEKLRQNYLDAEEEVLDSNFSAAELDNMSFDAELVKHLKSKSYSTSEIVDTLAQSDHVHNLLKQHGNNPSYYRQQVAKYIYSVGTKAGLSFNEYEKNKSPQKEKKSESEIEL